MFWLRPKAALGSSAFICGFLITVTMSLQDAYRLDRHAYLDSMVHRLDPRAKVLATLGFILFVVSFNKYALAPLTPFVVFPLVMAVLGFVPAGLILRRLLIAIPFIVFIGLFNPLLDRAPFVTIHGLAVSGGWVSFMSILARGFLCVAAAIVLIATTSMPRITEALGAMRVPRPLIVQLMLLYRYLFVLISEGSRLDQARELRSGRKKTRLATASRMISTLLIRTVDRSEAIYRAMQVRGFDGQLLTPRKMQWRVADSFFLALVIAGCAAFRFLPIIPWIGSRFSL
jgi:cobalt/nickel transport system permease protein